MQGKYSAENSKEGQIKADEKDIEDTDEGMQWRQTEYRVYQGQKEKIEGTKGQLGEQRDG